MDAIKKLTAHILKRLETNKSCVVFNPDTTRIWPARADEKRDKAIHAFARRNGLNAKISDPGIRITFRKLEA